MIEATSSNATLINRQASGTDNRAQQRLDANNSRLTEDAADSQPTSTAGVTNERVAISSQPTDQVVRTADTTESQATRTNTIDDHLEGQSGELAQRQAEVRTDQASLGSLLDTQG